MTAARRTCGRIGTVQSFDLFDREIDETRDDRPGDVVCFREGPDGAHQVGNDSHEPIRVWSRRRSSCPMRRCTRTAARWGSGPETTRPIRPRMFRIGTDVDYWDGEEA
jgi:hypothetical protein